MKVKELLGRFAMARSSINTVSLINGIAEAGQPTQINLRRQEVENDFYAGLENYKVQSFMITDNNLRVYISRPRH